MKTKLATVTLLFLLPSLVRAEYLHLKTDTDTILVDGQIVLTNSATIEARVMLTDPQSSIVGGIFNEWANGLEDKDLEASPYGVNGSAFGLSPFNLGRTRVISLFEWHHVAWVFDGSEQRIYLDGVLIGSALSSGIIRNSTGQPTIGAKFRDGKIIPAFRGILDFVHVSNLARYTVAFTPPIADPASDVSTQLLYCFDDAAGVTSIADSSSNLFPGILGSGFPGSTSPLLIKLDSGGTPATVEIAPAIALRFQAVLGTWYQIEQSTTLDQDEWTGFGSPILGDGTQKTIFDQATGLRKFYRVKTLLETE